MPQHCQVTYSVETLHGCKIVRGQVPVGDIAALAKLAGSGALMDIGISQRLGAMMVMGSRHNLDALRKASLPAGPAVQADLAAARAAGLSRQALDWLDGYERGTSSDALFAATTGVQVGSASAFSNHPHDPDDLRRCVLLVKTVPEVAANLHAARALGAAWSSLIDRWDDLAHLAVGEDYRACAAAMKEWGCAG